MSVPSNPSSVPALNLKAQYQTIRDEIEPVVREVLESQMFVLGPEVAGARGRGGRLLRRGHGIGCASGSDALLLPLMALEIGPGDEVITTPYTFFATGGCDLADRGQAGLRRHRARHLQHRPGADRGGDHAADAGRSSRSTSTARPPTWTRSARSPGAHGLAVLEDAAQAIGAAYHGSRAGTLGDVAAFSFYPSKNLGGFGDGGMITTDDPQLARRIARLRVHGMEPKYHHHEVGFNSRLDALQAAVLRVKLRHLDDWTDGRRRRSPTATAASSPRTAGRIGRAAGRAAGQLPRLQPVRHPRPGDPPRPAARLPRGRKIGTEIYYPIPLHLQVCFASLGHQPGDFPRAEAAARETIALPIYPELTDAEQQLRRRLDSPVHRGTRLSVADDREGGLISLVCATWNELAAPRAGFEGGLGRRLLDLGRSMTMPEPGQALIVKAADARFRAAHHLRGLLLGVSVEIDQPEGLRLWSGQPADPPLPRVSWVSSSVPTGSSGSAVTTRPCISAATLIRITVRGADSVRGEPLLRSCRRASRARAPDVTSSVGREIHVPLGIELLAHRPGQGRPPTGIRLASRGGRSSSSGPRTWPAEDSESRGHAAVRPAGA